MSTNNSDIIPTGEKIWIYPETSWRDGGGSGAKLSSSNLALACDLTDQIATTQPLPIPLRKNLDVFLNTKRNVGKVKNLGYDPGEETLSFEMLTGIWLYYALGSCSSTGTDLSTPFTDTIASGQGTNIITMTTNTAMTPDAHIGRLLTDSTDGTLYYITDNDASTLTLDRAVGSSANGDSVTITEAPYTHTISEANTLPSFTIHYEHSSKNYAVDILGCVVKSLEIVVEAGSDTPVMINVEINAPKYVDGDNLTAPTSNIDKDYFVRGDVTTLGLTYNSSSVDSALDSNCDVYKFKIENDIELKPTNTDEFPAKLLIGSRKYTISYGMYIRNTTLMDLQKLKVPNYSSQYGTTGYYAGALNSTFKLSRGGSSSDYIELNASYLKLNPNKELERMISWEDKTMYTTIELSAAPTFTLSATAKDYIHPFLYGRS